MNIITKRTDVLLNLAKASLEDVTEILDNYKSSEVLDNGTINAQPIIINGVIYQFKYLPQEAAALNARYYELTGHNHQGFLKEQSKALDFLLNNKNKLIKYGYQNQIEIFERLKANLTQNTSAIEVSVGLTKHILNKLTDVMMNLDKASLEDITALLNYYNAKPIIIDGVIHHPFNDPLTAAKLNNKYREFTGKDHEVFISETPIVIEGLLKEKDMLINTGVYSPSYFKILEELMNKFNKAENNISVRR